MTDVIQVRPASALRRDFAAWAVAQTPKVRTIDPQTFAVPGRLFTEVPELLMIGSTVDGHRYVSPVEDEQQERQAVPGQVLPEVPASAYGPDAVPLEPAEQGPAGEDAAWPEGVPAPSPETVGAAMDAVLTAAEVRAGPAETDDAEDSPADLTCPDCQRPYASERGLSQHRSRAHGRDQ